ncbi:unnamed protein product [Urochloa humidicola]
MEEGSNHRAATSAAALPDELIIEILARLPAKSLCRFSCVSRAWRTLISDPANRRRSITTTSTLSGCGDLLVRNWQLGVQGKQMERVGHPIHWTDDLFQWLPAFLHRLQCSGLGGYSGPGMEGLPCAAQCSLWSWLFYQPFSGALALCS